MRFTSLGLCLFLLFAFNACSNDDKPADNGSKLTLLKITGNGPTGRIRTGVKITGDSFDETVVVSLLTTAGSKVADLLVTSVSAQEIQATLPNDVAPGDYLVQLSKGNAQVATDVTILQGEQGTKGDKGDTGDTGPQGPQYIRRQVTTPQED